MFNEWLAGPRRWAGDSVDFLREPLRAGWERFGAQSRGLAALACLEGNTHRSTWELGLAATPNNRGNRRSR